MDFFWREPPEEVKEEGQAESDLSDFSDHVELEDLDAEEEKEAAEEDEEEDEEEDYDKEEDFEESDSMAELSSDSYSQANTKLTQFEISLRRIIQKLRQSPGIQSASLELFDDSTAQIHFKLVRPGQKRIQMQFLKHSLDLYLFNLDCCQVSFDGMHVRASAAAVQSLRTRTMISYRIGSVDLNQRMVKVNRFLQQAICSPVLFF